MERGYPNVTAESIAKAAGAGKQTLYRWWPSKAAVILAAFAQKGRARIDRPQEAAIRAGDLSGFLRSLFTAIAATAPALRHLMADAQTDLQLLQLLRQELIDPRIQDLRRVLEIGVADSGRRETLVAAIYGAIWMRLMLGERLDEPFADALAALARSGG
jgi:AcrR family transcriptional regulator